MAKVHRFEALGNAIKEAIAKKTEIVALGLMEDAKQPPYTVALSKDEQLEQYFAMDTPKWEALVQERGLADAVKYSEAMQKLVDERYGHQQPPTVIIAPQAFESPNQPEMQEPMAVLGQDTSHLQQQIQTGQLSSGAQQYVSQALQSAGVDPAMMGGGYPPSTPQVPMGG